MFLIIYILSYNQFSMDFIHFLFLTLCPVELLPMEPPLFEFCLVSEITPVGIMILFHCLIIPVILLKIRLDPIFDDKLGFRSGSAFVILFISFIFIAPAKSAGCVSNEIIVHSESTGLHSSWTSFEERVLMEPFSPSESKTSGRGEASVNQDQARPPLPANPGASGDSIGWTSFLPPVVPYPYQPDEMIGGDSVDSIYRRFLARYPEPSYEQIIIYRIDAEDLFEVKVEIIKLMAGLDPTGNWIGRGAQALDNPRTATGEPSLKHLYARLEDLTRSGKKSDTFWDLKSRMLSERAGDVDDNSVT